MSMTDFMLDRGARPRQFEKKAYREMTTTGGVGTIAESGGTAGPTLFSGERQFKAQGTLKEKPKARNLPSLFGA